MVDDPFAKVQLYYHLSKGIAWFRGLGLDKLRTPNMMVVANYRIDSNLCPGPVTTIPLWPYYNNAFFAPAGLFGHPFTGDVLAFGNGEAADLGWDGDIAYHELTHAVMHSAGNLGRTVRDPQGVDVSPWAMHEGLSDYFTAALTNDPYIADWFGSKVRAPSGGPLRDLTTGRRCNQYSAAELSDPYVIGQQQ